MRPQDFVKINCSKMISKLLVLTVILMAGQFGDAIRCYHCYDIFNKTYTSKKSVRSVSFDDKLVKCDKDRKLWNFWDCPREWPVCVITSAEVNDHYEVVRSCAVENFCSIYKPPPGMKIKYCHECNTSLCNDYPPLPDFPNSSGLRFVFNININLNLKKLPGTAYKKYEF